ncbi:hypothetical protein C8Q78DRAFT_1036207 [Trametes maxima]|nr:hypothetical protein C8Q78DRAFT_1036207 [Trametes maxima]
MPRRNGLPQQKGKASGTARAPSSNSMGGPSKTPAVGAYRILKQRREDGALEKALSIPLELLFEIFSHLDPGDLANVALSRGSFLKLLTTGPTAVTLWKASHANVDEEALPERPPYLSQVQFNRLLFGTQCYTWGCNSKKAKETFVWCSARYCTACKPTEIISVEVEETFIDEICNTTGVQEPFFVWKDRLHHREVDRFRKAWEALAEKPEEQKKLAQESEEFVVAKQKHVQLLVSWQNEKKRVRKANNEFLRSARLQSIKARLTKEGFGDDVALISDQQFSKQSFARENALLTDRKWANMHKAVLDFVKYQRKLRARAQHEELLAPRIDVFRSAFKNWANDDELDQYDPQPWLGAVDPRLLLMPNDAENPARVKPADFLLMNPVRVIINNPADNAVVVPEDFTYVRRHVRTLVQDWYDARRKELNALCWRELPHLSRIADPVSLAICAFDCAEMKCDEKFMHYPEVLEHRCIIFADNRRDAYRDDSSYEAIVQEFMALKRWEDRAWTVSGVRMNKGVLEKARQIIRACGQDPDRATPEDLEQRGARLTCRTCEVRGLKKGGGLEAFDWRRAFVHQAGRAHSGDLCEWTVLPEKVTTQVQRFEDRLRDSKPRPQYLLDEWTCKERRCRTAVFDYQDLVAHFKSKHPSKMVDGMVDTDIGIRIPLMVPNELLHGVCIRYSETGSLEVFSEYANLNRRAPEEKAQNDSELQ